MNFELRRTSEPHRLLLNLADKTNLSRNDKYVAISNLKHVLYMEKYLKNHAKAINLKYQLQNGMKNLIYLKYHILYQIFKIILNIS